MKSVKCYGTAYEIGMRKGEQMRKQECVNAELYRMYCSAERVQYAQACEAIYQKYDPQVIEEMHGLCDALGLSYEEIRTFLFGMYAYTSDVHCSCVAMCGKDGVYLGRNSDFLKKIAPYCLHEENHHSDLYEFAGNTTAFIELEDGMNEHGLALGLTYVRPHKIKPGFQAGLLVRYLLGHCQSVKVALAVLQDLPIGTAQTITMVDRLGSLAVVECNCEHMEVIRSEEFVYAVNAFQSEGMRSYRLPETLDDLSSGLRYQTLQNACTRKPYDFSFLQALLQGQYGFLCQYPLFCPADTIWSAIYDPIQKQSYLCEGNPSKVPYTKIH